MPLWLVGQAGEVRGESSYSELGSVIVWLRKGLGSGGEGLGFFYGRSPGVDCRIDGVGVVVYWT